MCFGGQRQQAYPPTPPSPEQVAYDKLQRDKEIRRASYLANGLPDPGGGTVVIAPEETSTKGDVILGATKGGDTASYRVK
jgi:hypothetical protein